MLNNYIFAYHVSHKPCRINIFLLILPTEEKQMTYNFDIYITPCH